MEWARNGVRDAVGFDIRGIPDHSRGKAGVAGIFPVHVPAWV
jgi:hypothetical protein